MEIENNSDELTYILPKELIAQEPVEPRESSRLMVLDRENVIHARFSEIVDFFGAGDVLVLNDTKVFKAKLFGKKESGGKVEMLLLFNKGRSGECLIKGRKLEGKEIIIEDGQKESAAFGKILGRRDGIFHVEFDRDAGEIISCVGKTPLPPYIRKSPANVHEKYNTVYAKHSGSIAAPTAGLHFTKELLEKIERKGVKIAYITLHVGLSTFLNTPYPELVRITEENAEMINPAIKENRLFAVGTTTVKALETANTNGKIEPCERFSNLFIDQNYRFKTKIRGIITNFHLPNAPPLKLVCAFAGKEKILKAYEEAIRLKYRFYSFGDAMLVINQ